VFLLVFAGGLMLLQLDWAVNNALYRVGLVFDWAVPYWVFEGEVGV
jgi:hypothetical protein